MSFVRILPVFIATFFIFSFSQSFAANTWEVTSPLILGESYATSMAGVNLAAYGTLTNGAGEIIPPSFSLDGLYWNPDGQIPLSTSSYICIPTKKNGVFLENTAIQTFMSTKEDRVVDEKSKNSLLKNGKINGVDTPFLFIRGTREMARMMRVECLSPQMNVVAGDTVIIGLHLPKKSTLVSSDLVPGKKRVITRSIADQSSTTALYKISAADICQNNIDHCDIQKVEITDIHGLTQDITENYKNAGDGYIFAPDIATVRIVSVKK